MYRPENPKAFPAERCGNKGMTLRDYFAAACDVSVYGPFTAFELSNGRKPTISELASYVAEIRMIEADAMLTERAKK